ncbi:MAG: FAD-binding oxidoreductase [Alphaproteobacteria bacterium]|nr:FAD-binding oxidoreductase [Alphaproteobacteria bacterium]
MTEHADVLIAGGGVVGSSTAFFLTGPVGRAAGFKGRVVVVEPDPTYADCSTARSAGGIRMQFSTPENIRMSAFGSTFIKAIDQWLAVEGERVDINYREAAYLFVATQQGMPILEQNHRTQTGEGHAVALLDPAALKARFPWLSVDGIAGGSLGLKDEGWMDPYSLLQAFKRKARAQGAVYVTDRVVSLERQGDRVVGATLQSGRRIAVGAVVNAAGPRAAEIARMAGIELPVRPRKRSVFTFQCKEKLGFFPLLIDVTGAWVRPEGDGYICGISPPEDQDPDTLDLEVEHAQFDEVVWPAIATRVPAFEQIKQGRAWAGHYEYNTLDQNALLGLHPGSPNLYFANGFSGHGLQQSPATGRAVAELLAHGRYVSLDLSRFSVARVVDGRAVKELNVV